ncbi:helix-turn-helix transcriptional regulator [Virgibacillus oceani]
MTKKELRETLINARKEKHLTHEQVASLTDKGITRQYYGMIENGERTPSVDVAKLISEVLEVDWTIFFELNSNHKLQHVI